MTDELWPETVWPETVWPETVWPETLDAVRDCDLACLKCEHSAHMVRDGLRAVIRVSDSPEFRSREMTANQVWTHLAQYSPEAGKGFMFSADDAVVMRVQQNMEIGHSGCSMGWTMRQIEFIAKNGLPAYRELFQNA